MMNEFSIFDRMSKVHRVDDDDVALGRRFKCVI